MFYLHEHHPQGSHQPLFNLDILLIREVKKFNLSEITNNHLLVKYLLRLKFTVAYQFKFNIEHCLKLNIYSGIALNEV